MKSIIIVCCAAMVVSCGCSKRRPQKLAQMYHQQSVAHAALAMSVPEEEAVAYRRSLDAIDKAIELDDRAEYKAFKATVLFKMQQFTLSERLFEQALQKVDSGALRGEILNNYACLLAQTGNVDRALHMWQELGHDEHYPTPELAFVNQGRIFALKDDYPKAKESFLKALALAPDYVDAHYYLMLLAKDHGETHLAKQSAQAALYLAPDHKGVAMAAAQLGMGAVDGVGKAPLGGSFAT